MAVTHLADVPTADTTPAIPTADEPVAVPRRPGALEPGVKVEVRRRLDDKWARGFEIIESADDGVRVRRLSDGVEIPATFPVADVRKERKRDTWWY